LSSEGSVCSSGTISLENSKTKKTSTTSSISSKTDQKTAHLKNILAMLSTKNNNIKEEYNKIIDLFQNFKSKILFLIDDEYDTNTNNNNNYTMDVKRNRKNVIIFIKLLDFTWII